MWLHHLLLVWLWALQGLSELWFLPSLDPVLEGVTVLLMCGVLLGELAGSCILEEAWWSFEFPQSCPALEVLGQPEGWGNFSFLPLSGTLVDSQSQVPDHLCYLQLLPSLE